MSELEEQLKRVYRCLNCGRQFRLARHSRTCPKCGGQLVTVTVKQNRQPNV